jgi:hypothetical protein
MNLLLILLGIYVYFVVGNLGMKLVAKIDPDSQDLVDPENGEELFFSIYLKILFPLAIPMLILCSGFIKFPTLHKIDIPFTPKKVADFLCNIRIEGKADLAGKRLEVPMPVGKPGKIGRMMGSPGCFGKNYAEKEFVEKCKNCDFGYDCSTRFFGVE